MFAAGSLAPYEKKFTTHQQANDFIDKVADLGIAKHLQDSFENSTFEVWERSGYNPSRLFFYFSLY